MAGPTGNESNHVIDGLTVRGGLALEGAGGVVTYLNRDVSASTARLSASTRGQGFISESMSRLACAAQTITITQTVYFMGIGLLAGDVVTNLHVAVGAGSASASLTKLGLYSSAGSLLASSADVTTSASFTTAGVKTAPMTTPYLVLADTLYYAAFLNVSAVTAANMFRGGVNLSAAGYGAPTGGVGVLGAQVSQTDLPASATISFGATPIPYWIGVS